MANTAARLDPNDYQAHWVLGWAYLYNRQFEQAKASMLTRGTQSERRGAPRGDGAISSSLSTEPHEQSIKLKEAIRLNPYHEGWYMDYLGWAYEDAGMYEEAIETIEPTIEDPVPGRPALASADVRGRLRQARSDGRREKNRRDVPLA